jgi:hypothetical protein
MLKQGSPLGMDARVRGNDGIVRFAETKTPASRPVCQQIAGKAVQFGGRPDG